MRIPKIILIAFMACTFLVGHAIAEQDSNRSDTSPAIKREHHFLINQLNQSGGANVRIKTDKKTGNVRYIGADPSNAIRQPSKLSARPTHEEAARGFLSVYGPLYGLKDQDKELKVMRSKKADRGRSFVRFQQIHSGVPIFGGECIVQIDSSNDIISAHGKILPDVLIDTTPVISTEMAEKIALEVFIATYQDQYDIDISSLQVTNPELWIYNPTIIGKNENITYLVWRIEISPKEMLPIKELIFVEAKSGDVVLHFNQSPTALYREIYDHNNMVRDVLPGYPSDLKRSEGEGSSGITDVDNAYQFAGDTYNFYWMYHGRDSIDNGGMEIITTTRTLIAPAAWAPAPYNQIVLGDGYASADDVLAHELTHGVTQFESGLNYINQSGAINEAFSDIWGEFVDLTNGRGNDSSTVRWLLAEDAPGGAIRNMKNPPGYADPDRMWSNYYYCGSCDQGGVHINSGVGNKAAYLMTDGGSFNGITVTGLGITKVAKIFYEVQTNLLTSASDYEDLANALQQACMNLVGTDGITTADCHQVDNAIIATEMNRQAPTNPLQNPSFESGHVSWTEYSSGGFYIITNSTYYPSFCGNWYGWLGGYNNAVDYIYQDVTIPSFATQASLQFFYGIITSETSWKPYDYLKIEIRRPSDNALLATLTNLSNLNKTSYWVRSTEFDLLPYKGQPIRIRFYATNNSLYPTNFLVDDVVLKTVVGGETVYAPDIPSGPTNGGIGASYSYTASGSSSDFGHSIQYFFDWGDGTTSGWLPVGTNSASHSWASVGTYSIMTQARCATHTSVISAWPGALSVAIDSVSTPTAPTGPSGGTTRDTYTYFAGGASSALGHSIQYLFDWGDGTNSGWLPVGTSNASHAWSSAGIYLVNVQARCASHTSVTSALSEPLTVNIVPSEIALQSPSDAETIGPCALIPNYQPAFSWIPTGTYTGYKILFSTSPTDFISRGIVITKASVSNTYNSWKPSSFNWKKIMKSSYNYGSIRPIYWKVVGTKADKTTVESAVWNFSIGTPQPVTINALLDGAILDPAMPPTFDFDTSCNTKFRLEISSLSDFSVSTNVKAFNFRVSDPNLVPSLQKTLSSFQWNGVKKLVGTAPGYFRIKAYDAIGRETISEVRTFTIQ